MAALPENWEMDYDGAISRWFYRFKPTGLIQYTFPKPGDEFPEFVGDLGGPMPPEDKFLSQKLKKGSAGSETIPASPPFNISTTATPSTFSGSSYNNPPPWFQPDEFMYMGPGAYNDTSPGRDESEAGLPATNPKTPESKVTRPPTRPFISPVTSTETTPLVSSNRLSVVTIPEQNTPARVESAPAAGDSIQSPVVPMLDGRPITQVFPLGFVAELCGETTARPRGEHPAAAELPGHEAAIRNIQLANSNQHAPVELSSESISVKATSGAQSQKTTNSQKPDRPNLDRKTESSPFILGANFASGPSNPAPARTHRHFIQGQVPSRVEVPAVSSEKQTLEKTGLDGQQGKAEPGAELESKSKANGQADNASTQRVPSVLQPARGRPKRLQNASGGQQGSSTTNSFVHRPLYDLPELDHQTVKGLHGHQSMTLLNQKDALDPPPAFTRTNTLPVDLPSLPFMGNGFSSKTETSSPAPKPQDQQPLPPPASSEEEPQMGTNFASTTRPHRGSLSDYANPGLPDTGQSVKPRNIIRKPSPTEAQGVDQSSLAVKDSMEQTAPTLAQELSQAMLEFAFRPHYEAKRATEMVMSDDGLLTVLWCQERMQLRQIPSEQSTGTLPATTIQGPSVPEDGSHSLPQPESSGSVPRRPEKMPLDNPQSSFTPYRPPAGEQTIRPKPITEPPSSHGIPTWSIGLDQQGGTFPQQGTQEHYVLPYSHEQQPPSRSFEALPQPDISNTGIPQTYPAQQELANPQSQVRASTWPKPELTSAFDVGKDDLASKPLPAVPQVMSQSMPQARGLQSEPLSPVVKEKRGLLSKFRRTANTSNSSNKLQKSGGNGYPTASSSVPQPQPPVSYRRQQSPPQNSQFPSSLSHPNQRQFQGYQWPANRPEAWSASGHDPRAFKPTIQLGGPQHEPEFVYQTQAMSAHQQQQQQYMDTRRESEVSNLTGTSSPSPVPSNADTVSIADSSGVSIISSHHTRPGSEGAASLASVSTIGRNSEMTPPPNFNGRNGPGPCRWGGVSGGGGGGQYDGSGWG
ncbi:hypothetical protein QBC32DRAFT_382558 [Pseudoneurospora amorphoporcata]|uniref:WW domain-containing protein n=1 Tax=Pseudoneurospora amorphoporcata TaxID=241081 RepID=A0AAN6SCJ0_9PEZI|nr:hypothetical protein QBC32DRAFT_382558 [Pseudoneurospora amorphoporcata]